MPSFCGQGYRCALTSFQFPGAVFPLCDGGEILTERVNRAAQTRNPTAQAEVVAIREAAAKLQSLHQVKPVSTPPPQRFGLPNFSM